MIKTSLVIEDLTHAKDRFTSSLMSSYLHMCTVWLGCLAILEQFIAGIFQRGAMARERNVAVLVVSDGIFSPVDV